MPPSVTRNSSHSKCYLPPAEEGHVLLQEYLHDLNSKLPIIPPKDLYALFQDCYSDAATTDPLAWVLVYVTMGITYRLRAMSLFAIPDDTTQADWYLEQSLAKLPELLLQTPSLRLVQASVSIALLLATSGRCQRAPLFASTALHMAQDLGYNEVTPEQAAESVFSVASAYVFWLAFTVDVHLSLANQRPSAQRLVGITTPAPAADVVGWWQTSSRRAQDTPWNLNVFAMQCSLAIIGAEAAEELFTARARQRSSVENTKVDENVVAKLHEWRKGNVLSSLNTEEVLKAMYRSDVVHSIMLEGEYF